MRRLSIVFIFFILAAGANAQSALDGEWINIEATRIDGSRIVKKLDHRGFFLYVIQGGKIFNVDSPYYHLYKNAMIGNELTYLDKKMADTGLEIIELISDSVMVMVQKYRPDELDKKNKYFLLRRKEYFSLLKRNGKIKYVDDSTLRANSYVFPIHEVPTLFDGLTSNLYEQLKPVSGSFTGYFILNTKNQISEIQIVENRGFSKIERFKKLLKKTEANWKRPIDSLNIKVEFTFCVVKEGRALDCTFKLNDFAYFNRVPGEYFPEWENKRFKKFNSALVNIKENKFDKAIEELTWCIGFDPLDFDCYYNRAYAYQQLGQMDKACADWKYLSDLGQVKASKLFAENCK